MKTYKSLLVVTLGVALATLSAQTGFATPPSAPTGSITNVVTGYTNVLWDATLLPIQNMELDITAVDDVGTNELIITYPAPYTQDGKGKLAGAGATTVSATNETDIATTFPGTYASKGSLKGNNGLATVNFSGKVAGIANIDGTNHAMKASAKYAITLDANAGTISGTSMEKASASGFGSAAETKTFSNSIPAELGDGSWTLVLTFGVPVGTKLTGTATVTLATGQVYPFDFKGTYVVATNRSMLSLKGTGDGSGSKLTVTLDGNTVIGFSGKISGQIVKL